MTPRIVSFRLWPPVAVGVPLAAGWLATWWWGDPVELGGWATPAGLVAIGVFVVWNGWALVLFSRHDTGLLPGEETRALIEEGPYRVSRNPLYVGLLALYVGLALLTSFWTLVLAPVAWVLLLWGAILPEERFLRAQFGATYEDYCRRVRRWL